LAEFFWLTSHENIQGFLRTIPAHRQHRVCFERLVSEPRASLEGLCRFLGLDLVPDMMEPYQEKRQRMTDGVSHLSPMVGDPKFPRHETIDAGTADRWRKCHAQDILSPRTWEMAETLGYVRDGPPTEQRIPDAPGSTPLCVAPEAGALPTHLD